MYKSTRFNIRINICNNKKYLIPTKLKEVERTNDITNLTFFISFWSSVLSLPVLEFILLIFLRLRKLNQTLSIELKKKL